MYTDDVNVDVTRIASKMPLYDCLSNTDIIIHIQQTEATQKFRNNVIVKKHCSRMIRAQRPSPTLVRLCYVMLSC